MCPKKETAAHPSALLAPEVAAAVFGAGPSGPRPGAGPVEGCHHASCLAGKCGHQLTTCRPEHASSAPDLLHSQPPANSSQVSKPGRSWHRKQAIEAATTVYTMPRAAAAAMHGISGIQPSKQQHDLFTAMPNICLYGRCVL